MAPLLLIASIAMPFFYGSPSYSEFVDTPRSDARLLVDLWLVKEGNPLVVVIPEVGFGKESVNGIVGRLRAIGVNVMVIENRGYGLSTGFSPWFRNFSKGKDMAQELVPLLGDVLVATKLGKERAKPRALVLVGHGVGGGLALIAAYPTKANATIAIAPPPVPGILGPREPPNLLLIAGSLDGRVPFELVSWLGLFTDARVGKVSGSFEDGSARSLFLSNADHYGLILDPMVIDEIERWVVRSIGFESNVPSFLPNPAILAIVSTLLLCISFGILIARPKEARYVKFTSLTNLMKSYTIASSLILALAIFILFPWLEFLGSTLTLFVFIPVAMGLGSHFSEAVKVKGLKREDILYGILLGLFVGLLFGWSVSPINSLIPRQPQLLLILPLGIVLIPFMYLEERSFSDFFGLKAGLKEFVVKAIALILALVLIRLSLGTTYPFAPHAYWFIPALLLQSLAACWMRSRGLNSSLCKAFSWAVWISSASSYLGTL